MKSFAELTRKEKLIELLRWICVLPVAWLAGLVGDFLTYSLVVWPMLSELSYEGTDRWLRHLIGRFLGGAAFVVAGAVTAPRFHFATAIVLAAGTIVFDVRTHREDYLPVVAVAVAATFGAAVSFYVMKAKGRPSEFGMAILVIPVLLCSLELNPVRSVFGTTWPGWAYNAIAASCGGLGGAIMATHRLRGTVSGVVAGLGALAALGFVLQWWPAIPRIGFIAVSPVGALPGLGLYCVFILSSRSSINKD